MRDAIAELRNAGILFVSSAGNGASGEREPLAGRVTGPRLPACLPGPRGRRAGCAGSAHPSARPHASLPPCRRVGRRPVGPEVLSCELPSRQCHLRGGDHTVRRHLVQLGRHPGEPSCAPWAGQRGAQPAGGAAQRRACACHPSWSREPCWLPSCPCAGMQVHLGAPGANILSSWFGGDSQYVAATGTSMSAPAVTGAAVLLFSARPDASYLEVRHALLSSVDVVPGLTGKVASNGRLNVAKALAALLSLPAPYVAPADCESAGPPRPHPAAAWPTCRCWRLLCPPPPASSRLHALHACGSSRLPAPCPLRASRRRRRHEPGCGRRKHLVPGAQALHFLAWKVDVGWLSSVGLLHSLFSRHLRRRVSAPTARGASTGPPGLERRRCAAMPAGGTLACAAAPLFPAHLLSPLWPPCCCCSCWVAGAFGTLTSDWCHFFRHSPAS